MKRLVMHVDVNSAFLSWEAARRVARGEACVRRLQKKGAKRIKEKYATEHMDELTSMKKAFGYLMHRGGTANAPVEALQAEYNALREQNRQGKPAGYHSR